MTSVEKLEGLERKLSVTVPAEQVTEAYSERLTKVAKTAKVDGFRPGKVPTREIEKRYGHNILMEVAQDLIKDSFSAAIDEHKLTVVSTPDIEPNEIKKGQAIVYTAKFEVYPEFELADVSAVKIQRPVVKLQKTDTDKLIEVLRQQNATLEEVERAAANGDVVVIDFEGSIDGEQFEGGSAKDFDLKLGSARMISGFEEGIVGAKVGEAREVKCCFPKDYHRAELSEKEAVFKVTVKKISEQKLAEVTDEFAKDIGYDGGLAELNQDIEKNMMRQITQALNNSTKSVVLDKLFELNQVEVPRAMVDAEIQSLQDQSNKKQGKQSQDLQVGSDQLEQKARRQVTLGLLLSKLIKKFDLKPDPVKVHERIELIASVYPDSEKVIQDFYSSERLLNGVESAVIEDQVVEKLLEEMQVEEKELTYDEAVKDVQNQFQVEE